MSRKPREASPNDIYHIFIRGVGRQLIFEDDWDRRHFLNLLEKLVRQSSTDIYAWCLMDNHVHLLLHGTMESVSTFMQSVESGYAISFNQRHERVGTLFQGRFQSVPIMTDEQLMVTVRYIHRNPVEVGGTLESPWSSYREYRGTPFISSTEYVLAIFGGLEQFVQFHLDEADRLVGFDRMRLSPREQYEVARSILGNIEFDEVKTLGRTERNQLLRQLKNAGITIRQIERLTSIGRGIIARA